MQKMGVKIVQTAVLGLSEKSNNKTWVSAVMRENFAHMGLKI